MGIYYIQTLSLLPLILLLLGLGDARCEVALVVLVLGGVDYPEFSIVPAEGPGGYWSLLCRDPLPVQLLDQLGVLC